MKREIKFRGYDNRGNVFYGSYNQNMGVIDDWEYAASHAVEDKNVSQLVGHDKNGAEVYETDTLIDELGNEYEATIYMRPDELKRLTLVKAA